MMRRSIVLVLIVVSISVVFIRPQLGDRKPSKNFDLGDVWVKPNYAATVEIINRTSSAKSVAGVMFSCNCTTADFSNSTVEGNGSLTIPVAIDTSKAFNGKSSYLEPFEVSGVPFGEAGIDDSESFVPIRISGIVHRWSLSTVARLDFGFVSDARELRGMNANVTLLCNPSVQSIRAVANSNLINPKIERLAKNEFQLTVSFSEVNQELSDKPLEVVVSPVFSNDGRQLIRGKPDVTIPVIYELRGTEYTVPDSFIVGQRPVGKSIELLLTAYTTESLANFAAEDCDSVSVVRAFEANGLHAYALRLTKKIARSGDASFEARINASSLNGRECVFPVAVSVFGVSE